MSHLITQSGQLDGNRNGDVIRDALRAAGVVSPSDPVLAEQMAAVLAFSPFVERVLAACPEFFAEYWGVRVGRAIPIAEIHEQIASACRQCDTENRLSETLRRQRNQALVRIAINDLLGLTDIETCLAEQTAVAEACIAAAVHWLSADSENTFGKPVSDDGSISEFVVFGMGKLGGGELNFSSDIDLIFAYSAEGETDGPRSISNNQYFTRLGRKLIQLLDETTAHGRVHRVDMRLRPFGESGPLVSSFDGLEHYYQVHGREWERYALVKARPVAGSVASGEQLLERLRPFVYRRYLDYGVFDSLREIKASIDQQVRLAEYRDHVKLGRGGIREAEFIVQLFQLIRGGREPELRQRNYLVALRATEQQNCLSSEDAADLRNAYLFLRRVENLLQIQDDQQTHELPTQLDLFAERMGYGDVVSFVDELRRHREVVEKLFSQTVQNEHRKPVSAVRYEAILSADAAQFRDEFLADGFADADRAIDCLNALREQLDQQHAGVRARKALARLLPEIIAVSALQNDAMTALERLCRLIENVVRRTTYMELLVENPQALDHLARIVAGSRWVTELVIARPILLDELIDPRLFSDVPDPAELDAELGKLLSRYAEDDLEARMDALREFQQSWVMRIAVADIDGRLPVMRVSDALTAVAEAVIRHALAMADIQLQAKHGKPGYRLDGKRHEAGFLVVAYGKLAGYELGYGSDLDLVFIHDSTGEEQQTDGARVLDNAQYFLRVTQRMIHMLSTPTAVGMLYDVDTRLRPSGKGGLLVTTLDAFRQYQLENAWTWEHQALLRSRPIAGSERLTARFAELRMSVLTQPRSPDELAAQVLAMRQRMREEQKVPPGVFDLKASPGGLTDIEFLAQYWVLLHAQAHPEVAMFPDTIRCLEGLDSCNCLRDVDLPGLVECYRTLRRLGHHQSLQGASVQIEMETVAAESAYVTGIWRSIFPNDA